MLWACFSSGKAIADNHTKVKQFKDGQLIQKKVALDLYKKANILPVCNSRCGRVAVVK